MENRLAILRVATVAADLDLSRRSVRRLCEAGELPAFKVGGKWVIIADEYYQFIEAKKNDAVEIFITTLEAKKKLKGAGQNG